MEKHAQSTNENNARIEARFNYLSNWTRNLAEGQKSSYFRTAIDYYFTLMNIIQFSTMKLRLLTNAILFGRNTSNVLQPNTFRLDTLLTTLKEINLGKDRIWLGNLAENSLPGLLIHINVESYPLNLSDTVCDTNPNIGINSLSFISLFSTSYSTC